jgi:glycosyltransferase involved in cell wall biosynthesis
MYSRYNKIISISQETQEALTQWLGQYDSRFVVVNNGINIQKFSSLNVPVVPKSLIMVSRFATSKDQETVIRAMPEIDNEAILYFIGDGENKYHCEVLAKELGVSNRVYFLGSRSNVAELIASSYIGIQSSKWEGFGLTAVEIMACSKPIIATNVDGLKQVVEGAGEIFTLGSHSELAVIVNNLLRDKQYYQYIVDRCKERAKIYDISKTSEGYMKIYNTIL